MVCEYRDVELAEQPMDCAFHPEDNIIALGLIDGSLQLLTLEEDNFTEVLLVREHEESCRSVHFASDGKRLLTGSADKSIAIRDVVQQQLTSRLPYAHEAAITRILAYDDWHFTSADDNGIVKAWDMRQKAPAQTFSSHKDSVTDLLHRKDPACVLATSADGSLSVNDLRSGKVRIRSDGDPDEELLSGAMLKNGRKIICGTQSGHLNIYSWNDLEEFSDRLPGHPSSVDCLLKLDEDTVITGAGDGIIRVLSIQPHCLLGLLGEQSNLGLDRLALSHDRKLLAGTSYAASLRLWDTSCLDDSEEDTADVESAQTNNVPQLPAESSSSGETSSKQRQKKQKKRLKTRTVRSAKPNMAASFFKDMV